jgi:hypothetical protein
MALNCSYRLVAGFISAYRRENGLEQRRAGSNADK